MFTKLKRTIKELAKQAVYLAEKTQSGEDGKRKKQMALEYIISNIPVFAPFKKIIAKLLSDFIDDAIELSVLTMKSLSHGFEQ